MAEPTRKGKQYDEGELEIILSLVPTQENVANLAALLKRSTDAIELVYKIAYRKNVGKEPQKGKVLATARKLRIISL